MQPTKSNKGENDDMSTVQQEHSLLYLNKQDIIDLQGLQSEPYVKAVTRALELHARKDTVQPLKPYLRVNEETGHIADRIIAMPAYVGGDIAISGLKWIGSKHDNPQKRQKERASALIILNDPESNYPVAVMEGSIISGMRTAAVTVIGLKAFGKRGIPRRQRDRLRRHCKNAGDVAAGAIQLHS